MSRKIFLNTQGVKSFMDAPPKKQKNKLLKKNIFLTGLIWGRTVFCIDIGNITLTHMVKLHLPHMYMIFVDNFKENSNPHLFYNTPELFNTFGIIRDFLKPFASSSLGPFQLLQRHFLLFLWLWPRSIPSLPLLLANLVINFFTIFVPRPIQ